jgi:tryptophan synthase alpha chain
MFNAQRAQQRVALIPFLTVGDPSLSLTLELMHTLVAAGADLLELGMPFSDPIADGPVIQRATERALAQGVSLRHVLELVQEFRTTNETTPIVLMGYLNPIERLGYESFARQAQSSGVDGLLIVDMPPEESQVLLTALRQHGLDLVHLLAPTSDEERIQRIATVASGFVYYVSIKGVTGAGHLNIQEVAEKLTMIRSQLQLPVGVGFGIKNAETAAQIAQIADAVIVGSALVERIETLIATPEQIGPALHAFIQELRHALDHAKTIHHS